MKRAAMTVRPFDDCGQSLIETLLLTAAISLGLLGIWVPAQQIILSMVQGIIRIVCLPCP